MSSNNKRLADLVKDLETADTPMARVSIENLIRKRVIAIVESVPNRSFADADDLLIWEFGLTTPPGYGDEEDNETGFITSGRQ